MRGWRWLASRLWPKPQPPRRRLRDIPIDEVLPAITPRVLVAALFHRGEDGAIGERITYWGRASVTPAKAGGAMVLVADLEVIGGQTVGRWWARVEDETDRTEIARCPGGSADTTITVKAGKVFALRLDIPV